MSILAYNGAAIIGMAGKNCVAIASALRFGINPRQTTAVDMKKIYEIHPHLYVGLSGASESHWSPYDRVRVVNFIP